MAPINSRNRWPLLAVFGLLVLLGGTTPVQAVELIFNGDFELGNIGFTTDYLFSPGNIAPEQSYDVLVNPNDAHSFAASYGDHTTGTGLMMAVNGGFNPTAVVWSQTVAVASGTDYVFSIWVSSWFPDFPANLEFLFNGVSIGTFDAPAITATWDIFGTTWNSGAATSLTIAIVDNNTIPVGNDFALDDISLTAAVPEPHGLTLAALALGGVLLHRRRRP